MRRIALAALIVIGACGKGDGKGGRDDDPGLLGYQKMTKKSEGELHLELLEKLSKKYFYAHDNRFPVMKIGPTPDAPCCTQPDQKCQPNASDWTGTDWDQLHFSMVDAPFRFQYSYESDGTTFTATATADLDCDALDMTTFVAHGRVVAGEPEVTIEMTSKE